MAVRTVIAEVTPGSINWAVLSDDSNADGKIDQSDRHQFMHAQGGKRVATVQTHADGTLIYEVQVNAFFTVWTLTLTQQGANKPFYTHTGNTGLSGGNRDHGTIIVP